MYSTLSRTGVIFKPITRRHILESSKLIEFADDNFKFDENGRKLTKRVENTVGKVCYEQACYEQFLLSPQCFQKTCFPGASLCGNGLNHIYKSWSENAFNFDYCKNLSLGKVG